MHGEGHGRATSRAPISSRRPFRVNLTARATADFEDILLHGVQTWGEERAAAYDAALEGEIDKLAQFPFLGRSRSDWPTNFRALVVRDHVVVYHVDDEAVTVVRILHRRQDAAGLLGE